jgi:hypothetical protein
MVEIEIKGRQRTFDHARRPGHRQAPRRRRAQGRNVLHPTFAANREQSPSVMSAYNRNRLVWHKSDRGYSLHLGQSRSPLLILLPASDVRPGAWRVHQLDGKRLSEAMNLTLARDAAQTIGMINLRTAEQSPADPPPMRPDDQPLYDSPQPETTHP